jgi:hypothetical protein
LALSAWALPTFFSFLLSEKSPKATPEGRGVPEKSQLFVFCAKIDSGESVKSHHFYAMPIKKTNISHNIRAIFRRVDTPTKPAKRRYVFAFFIINA